MKGITHFAAGIAAASCFPHAVAAGAAGNPLYFILGGVCALLPDTLDFKFARFFYRRDIEVTPDPLCPDPRMIAEAVSLAVTRASETGRPVRIKLNTVRLGADRWQRYRVRFDVPARKVAVALGPVVDTGGNPAPGAAGTEQEAEAELPCAIRLDYLATTVVDIFEGPVFRMAPAADGSVDLEFLPWHRKWSHGLVTGLVLALAAAAAWGPWAGVVALAAFATHTLLDQTGFMGVNLLYPFTRQRTTGRQWSHSGAALPNLAACWLSAALVFWNLYRASPAAAGGANPLRFLFLGMVLPLGGLCLLRRALRGWL